MQISEFENSEDVYRFPLHFRLTSSEEILNGITIKRRDPQSQLIQLSPQLSSVRSVAELLPKSQQRACSFKETLSLLTSISGAYCRFIGFFFRFSSSLLSRLTKERGS